MAKKKLDPNFSNEKILEVIRDYSSDTIYFKDAHSRFVWNNRAHAAQFGVSDPREMAGKTDADFFPKDFATRARREEMEIMETRIPLISNTERLEKPDGSVVWYSASKYPIIDENDKVIGTWGISRNITALKIVEEELSRTNEKLKRLSQVDDLTGLFNRRYFYEMIEKTASQYDRRNYKKKNDPDDTFSLISLDIDFFKKINDDYTPLKGAKKQAERVRLALSEAPILLDERSSPVRLTASMGISCYKDSSNVADLIHTADERLYTSKNLGRDRAT